jgi:hypothetical protein
MGQAFLTLVPVTRDPEDLYSYPATAIVANLQNDAYDIHLIWYTAAPAALFNNAPNGSFLIDTTNGAIYAKVGTMGKKDGTWQTAALS